MRVFGKLIDMQSVGLDTQQYSFFGGVTKYKKSPAKSESGYSSVV